MYIYIYVYTCMCIYIDKHLIYIYLIYVDVFTISIHLNTLYIVSNIYCICNLRPGGRYETYQDTHVVPEAAQLQK